MNKEIQDFDRYREQELLEEEYNSTYESEDEWTIEDFD
jgi:hypothetical protein